MLIPHLRLRDTFVSLVALALPLAGACGGSKASPGDAVDGGGASTDAPSSSNDGALPIPAPGQATLSGPAAFPVGSASLGVSTSGACGGTLTPDSGVIPTVAIVLTSEGLAPALCSGLPDGGTGYFLDLEIATTQATTGDGPLTQSIAPGTYVVGDEGEDDPDICMLTPGTNAFLQIVTPTSGDAIATAISGTVTVDSVSAQAITGTFSVLMGGPYGKSDSAPPPSLSGAFNAVACP